MTGPQLGRRRPRLRRGRPRPTGSSFYPRREGPRPSREKALGDMLGGDLKAWGPEGRKHLAGDFKGIEARPHHLPPSRADKARVRGPDSGHPGPQGPRPTSIPAHKDPVVSTGIMDAFRRPAFVHCRLREATCTRTASLKYEWGPDGAASRTFAEIRPEPGPPSRRARSAGGCWTAHFGLQRQGGPIRSS